jgi:hypothetical protein
VPRRSPDIIAMCKRQYFFDGNATHESRYHSGFGAPSEYQGREGATQRTGSPVRELVQIEVMPGRLAERWTARRCMLFGGGGAGSHSLGTLTTKA